MQIQSINLLRYITAAIVVTLPVFAFSIAFLLLLMIPSAKLVTLIGRGSIYIKLRANGLSNLRHSSTCNPVSPYPDSYSLSELLLEESYERFLRFFLPAFLSPFFTNDSTVAVK